TALILIAYSLLPEHLRFSRALILLGAGWTITSFLLTRMLFHLARFKNLRIDSGRIKRMAIVGSPDECKRVQAVLRQTNVSTGFIGFVSVADVPENNNAFLGRFDQLNDIVTIYAIEEVVFCAKDLPAEHIIDRMAQLSSGSTIDFKIAPPESLSIIGSNSIDTAGDLYVIDINAINKPVNRRNKRVIDVGLSVLFLSLFPLLMWLMKKPIGFVANVLAVLFGQKSWVGYAHDADTIHLPKIKTGVLSSADVLDVEQRTSLICNRLNLLYAKDYKIENDLRVVWKAFRGLGN
ncbi:MAG: glycosyltransferase family 2 protein, partial [Bacteroidia bacterium]